MVFATVGDLLYRPSTLPPYVSPRPSSCPSVSPSLLLLRRLILLLLNQLGLSLKVAYYDRLRFGMKRTQKVVVVRIGRAFKGRFLDQDVYPMVVRDRYASMVRYG